MMTVEIFQNYSFASAAQKGWKSDAGETSV